MNYDKYIFDWQNELLEISEYADTKKYAFSPLNKARNALDAHMDNYNIHKEERENLEKIKEILFELYRETSHIETEFNN